MSNIFLLIQVFDFSPRDSIPGSCTLRLRTNARTKFDVYANYDATNAAPWIIEATEKTVGYPVP